MTTSSSSRTLQRKTPTGGTRAATCWSCGEVVPYTLRNQRVTCPSCGEEVSFENVIVLEQRVQKVRTLGELRILREAFLIAGDSYCGQLRIMGGGFAGKIVSQGEAKLENCQGLFRGELQCESFYVSKNSQIEFSHPVRCISAQVEGHFHGELLCSGVVKLGNEAHLEGTCRAQSIQTGVNSVLAASVSLRGKPKPNLQVEQSLQAKAELEEPSADAGFAEAQAQVETAPAEKARSYQRKLAAKFYQSSLPRPV